MTTGLLLLTCAALGGVVVMELVEGLPLAPAVTAAPPTGAVQEPTAAPAEFRPPPRRQFRATAARPLFSQSRRPHVPPPTPAPVAEPKEAVVATPVELVGVLLTDQGGSALLLPQGETKASWVRQGEEFVGWRVEIIERDWIELRQGDQQQIVELRGDDSVGDAVRRTARKRAKTRPAREQRALEQPAEASAEHAETPEPEDD